MSRILPAAPPQAPQRALPATPVVADGWPTPGGQLEFWRALTERAVAVGEPDRVSAATSTTRVMFNPDVNVNVNGRILTPPQMQAEKNATHPSTAFLLDAQAADYGDCRWEIVYCPNGEVDEDCQPVQEDWVPTVLEALGNDDESIASAKRRAWWLHHVHGRSVASIHPNEDRELGIETVISSLDATRWVKGRDRRTEQGLEIVRSEDDKTILWPNSTGHITAWDLVSSSPKRRNQPYTIMFALEPLYHLWWLLIRGDISTAESVALMNGMLFLPRERGAATLRSSTAGQPEDEDTQAIYNMMRKASPLATDDAPFQRIADHTQQQWKWPNRHVARLPIPYFGSKDEKPEMVDIGRKFDALESAKIDMVEHRLALGWNAPASVFLGSIGEARMSQYNAWTQESDYRKSIERGGNPIDAALTRSILWHVLGDLIGRKDYRRFALRSDYRRLDNPALKVDQWKYANESLGVRREAVMEGLGLPVDALLTDAEYAAWQASKTTPVQIVAPNQPPAGDGPGDKKNPADPPEDHDGPEAPVRPDGPGDGPDHPHRVTAALTTAQLNRRLIKLAVSSAASVSGQMDAEYHAAARRVAAELRRLDTRQAASINAEDIVATALAGVADRFRGRLKAILTSLVRMFADASGVTQKTLTAAVTDTVGKTLNELASQSADTATALLADRLNLAVTTGTVDNATGDDLEQAIEDADTQADNNTRRTTGLDTKKVLVALGGGAVLTRIADRFTPARPGDTVDPGSWLQADVADTIMTTAGYGDWELLEWVYGDEPRKPFNGHEQLDTIQFVQWDEPILAVQPGDEWVNGGSGFYAPGDHDGCLCEAVPVLNE